MARIGVQASTIKSEFDTNGTYVTLKRMAEIGFRNVEMSQVPMDADNVAEMKKAQEEFDIEFAALSAPLDPPPGGGDSLSETMDKIVDDCRTLGSSFVRIGMLPLPALKSKEGILDFARRADEAAVRMREQDITLCYHNHHVEFARMDGQFILDLIREAAPHLRFEIDLHWVHRGGVEPLKLLKDYADVTDLIHLKDYRIGRLGDEAFTALETGDFATFMNAFYGVVEFAEVGEGSLDFPELIEASRAIGAQHLLVEQDSTYDRTPFESLQLSYDNLVKMGYQDLM